MDFVLDFIENATMPVAMAANLEETQKLKKIEQKSLVLRFLQYLLMSGHLSPFDRIAGNWKIPDDILKKLQRILGATCDKQSDTPDPFRNDNSHSFDGSHSS